MDTILLPLSTIVIDQEYAAAFPPMPDEEYRLLKEDIRRSGMHTPIIVTLTTPIPGHGAPTYTLLAGHTRYKLHQELNITTIRASVAVTADQRISALFDNIYRRQLDKASVARFRAKEAEVRRHIHSRLIPSLKSIFPLLPIEVQSSLILATEECQEAFMVQMHQATRQRTPGFSPQPEPLASTISPILNKEVVLQQLTTELSDLEEALQKERKSGLQNHNKLSRDLETARDERLALEQQISIMKEQLQHAQGEVNAARLVADGRLGRTRGLTDLPTTPELLLQGLDYAQQLTGYLTVCAAKVPTLNATDAVTAQQCLRKITTHLDHLYKLIEPTHDGILQEGRTNNGFKGGKLALVNPGS